LNPSIQPPAALVAADAALPTVLVTLLAVDPPPHATK